MSITIKGAVTMGAAFTEILSGSGVIVPQTFQAYLNNLGSGPDTVPYSYGTAAGQGDLIYCKPLVLAASATTIDLTSLTGFFGETINFARVREAIGYNPDTTAGHDVTLSQGASNGWTYAPVGKLFASGGAFRIADPLSTGGGNGMIVDGTHKTVKFDPGANTITIYVLFFGGSAA